MTQKSPSRTEPDSTMLSVGRVSRSVCGRVLLYTQGMEIDPVLGLELALQCLRRASAETAPGSPGKDEDAAPAGSSAQGESLTPAAAMRELHALLCEKTIGFHLAGRDGRSLTSAPPMQRSAMLAEEMDFTPLRSALKKLFRKLSGNTPAEKRERPR